MLYHRWYNTPPTKGSRVGTKSDQITNNLTSSQCNTAPQHDYDSIQNQTSKAIASENTDVPNPSSYTAPHLYQYEPVAGEPEITADEAFSRALSATYWAGYWTAWYYHVRLIV